LNISEEQVNVNENKKTIYETVIVLYTWFVLLIEVRTNDGGIGKKVVH